MNCPFCDHTDSKVIDSREVDNGIRRRRQCLRCSLRFTTVERIQATALYVIKRDGRREEFSRAKLASGLRKACAKRPLPTGAIDKALDDIEGELQKLGKAEVPAGIIGELVINRLRELDRVAYIRFASVYRDFADVETFKAEVDTLLQGRPVAHQPSAQLPLLLDENGSPVRDRQRRGRGRKTKSL